jgi:hypothetical protein
MIVKPNDVMTNSRMNPKVDIEELSSAKREELLRALKARFEKNINHYEGLEWSKVQAMREGNSEKLWLLYEMERTSGEPDVVDHDKKMGEYIFYDCSAESPKGRRRLGISIRKHRVGWERELVGYTPQE